MTASLPQARGISKSGFSPSPYITGLRSPQEQTVCPQSPLYHQRHLHQDWSRKSISRPVTLYESKTLTELERESPSIYAVFYSLSVSNGCSSLSTTYDSITMSFTPGALSTVDPFGTTAEPYNFADLPCPPPGLYVEPGQPYQPQFAPPRAFFSSLQAANPAALQGCADGIWAEGWTDPPIAFVTAGPLDGPGSPGRGRPPRLIRDIPANAHFIARTPTQTAEPK